MRPERYGIHTGNRRNKGFRTGTQNQVFTFVSFATTLHGILVNDGSLSLHDIYTVCRQFAFNAQHQLAHYLLLAGDNLR